MTDLKSVGDFHAVLIPYYAELFCAEGLTEKLFALRFDGLQKLQACISHYSELGYMPELLSKIAERKGALIMAAKSKTEVEKIIKPHAPRYNGAEFISDPFLLPEEELICWSEASLRAPLNEPGYRRYMKLFRQVFPKESRSLNIA